MNIGDTVKSMVIIPKEVVPDEITIRFIRPNGTEAAVRTLTGGGVKSAGPHVSGLGITYIATYNADAAGTWKARGQIISGTAQSNPYDEFYVNRG